MALAVLAITLLAGAGVGVIDTGEQQLTSADRDLWVTTGETRITTTGGGGFENTLQNSRELSSELEAHEGVRHAIPLAFESVYVGTDPDSDFQTFVGTGTPGGGPAVQVEEGEQFRGDTHYAEGTYEGEMTHEVLIDVKQRGNSTLASAIQFMSVALLLQRERIYYRWDLVDF